MSAYERLLDALTAKSLQVQPRRDGQAAAQCPAHDDRNPSLSLARNDSGVLVHCNTGCRVDDILTALGMHRRDLFDAPAAQKAGYVVTAEYPYVDEQGAVLFVKERRWPKDFRQYRPTPGGRRSYTLGDVRRVLYRLPEVVAAIRAGQPVWVAEGEKDADALVRAGVCATTWPDGAWKPGTKAKWRPEYTGALAGADVVIAADDDETGRAAADIVKALTGTAKSVRAVLPTVGKDAADHLAAGHGVDDFRPLDVDAARPGDTARGESAHGERGPSQASQLVALAGSGTTCSRVMTAAPMAWPVAG